MEHLATIIATLGPGNTFIVFVLGLISAAAWEVSK